MKKLTALFPMTIILAFIFTGCSKWDDIEPKAPQPDEVEINFTGTILDNSFLKSTKSGQDIEQADYAFVTIDGVDFTIEVFYLNDIPYTQTIKVVPGEHTVTQFLLYDDSQTPGFTDDDDLIAATPEEGSDFASYITKATPFTFNTSSFEKMEVQVEVITFEEKYYQEFGFNWFEIDHIIVREQCFFGDFCVKNPDDYIGSMYENQTNGLQHDMSAIAKIEVWRSNATSNNEYELIETFSNASWNGEGEPLCVTYADYKNLNDDFKFKLYILVRSGTNFEYKLFHTWEFSDDEMIEDGDDGVVDYVLGTCVPAADFIFPPYMNLPPTASYKITGFAPGSQGGYLDAQLTNIASGYEITNGTYASWCYDHQVTIYQNHLYDMEVYSSLYPDLLPAYVNEDQWEKANWIMNHLDWYDGYEWYDIQGALWLLDDPQWDGTPRSGVPALSTMEFAQQMYDDANLYGDDYLPPPGGWAAVIFVPEGTLQWQTNPMIQTVFVVIDP